jgi:hypothetical protein
MRPVCGYDDASWTFFFLDFSISSIAVTARSANDEKRLPVGW